MLRFCIVRMCCVVTWLQSVPQFRAAFNSYLERSGMASSDDFQELVETADEETDASFAEGKRTAALCFSLCLWAAPL